LNARSTARKRASSIAPKRGNRPARAVDLGTKNQILEAALTAFARDGFDGASLPKIAEIAKIGHPLIHYYFGSKDNLWRETVEYAFGGLVAEATAVEAASRGLSPLHRLRVMVQAFAQFAARYPDHLGLIMAEARSDSKRLRWLRENYLNAFLGRLRRALKDAQEQNEIKKVPLDHLISILIGAVVLYFSINLGPPKNMKSEDLADSHAKWVLEVILDGIAVTRSAQSEFYNSGGLKR
jgi:AcrR family transcriptional regulator